MNRRAVTVRSSQINPLLRTACPAVCNELTISGSELQPEAHHSIWKRWEVVGSFREQGCAVQHSDHDSMGKKRKGTYKQKSQPTSKPWAKSGCKISVEMRDRSSKWCTEFGRGGRERKKMGCTELCAASNQSSGNMFSTSPQASTEK